MKTLLIAICLLVNSAYAETLQQLRVRVDTSLTNHMIGAKGLINRQNNYASNHGGKFWQGLLTFSSLPNHTPTTPGDSLADRLTSHPTDQSVSWHDVFPEWDTELFAAGALVDVYDGPLGSGWSITIFVKYQGIVYQRKKCFGPDVSDDYDWRIFDPGD